jgi:Tfp pilus assembly protein PilE
MKNKRLIELMAPVIALALLALAIFKTYEKISVLLQ